MEILNYLRNRLICIYFAFVWHQYDDVLPFSYSLTYRWQSPCASDSNRSGDNFFISHVQSCAAASDISSKVFFVDSATVGKLPTLLMIMQRASTLITSQVLSCFIHYKLRREFQMQRRAVVFRCSHHHRPLFKLFFSYFVFKT